MTKSATEQLPLNVDTARQTIQQQLDRYTQFDNDCPPKLMEAVRYCLLGGGKRIRPLLVLMSAEACGASIQAALPAACAVEMIHTYSLVHDDLPAMDDDQLRRGQPTCHVRFGEATAILAGDALIPLAFQVLATEYPPEIAARCCAELARASGASQLVGGQVDDLAIENDVSNVQRLENIHRRKTGALLTVAVRLGGIVACANSQQLDHLESFGKNLGLAFQIVDDLLDCHGDWTKMGKMTQKDRHQGKLTYPELLGVEESRQRAQALVERAVAALEEFGPPAEPLRSMARFVLERNQ